MRELLIFTVFLCSLLTSNLVIASVHNPVGTYACEGEYSDDHMRVKGTLIITRSHKTKDFHTRGVFEDEYGKTKDKGVMTATQNENTYIEEWGTFEGRKVRGLSQIMMTSEEKMKIVTFIIDRSSGLHKPEFLVCSRS